MNFPSGFIWGAASASYQVEGAAHEDGKGRSIWNMIERWPGKIWEGNTGDAACDHYHLYHEDARLMGEIGLQAYRFSIAWPRILPEGTGAVNPKGLDFYDRLVDALLANGVAPWATLFHWDYPYALHCRGGWLNRDSPAWFAEYAAAVIDKLSDRVEHWMTINEPQVFIGCGYREGTNAPCLQLNHPEVLTIAHHVLLAHGRAVRAIRDRARRKPCIGAAPVGFVNMPATGDPRDIEAARSAMFSLAEKRFGNTWFLDPMLRGCYPEDGLKHFAADLPAIQDGDLEIIHQPLDFFGINIYGGQTVRAAADGSPEAVVEADGPPLTAMEWRIAPEALYWGPRFFHERYGLPVVVTENGMANCDWVHLDGRVHDPQRIDFIARYLRAYARAGEDGIPIQGYFYWSITDNFEWILGYKPRFGLIHVDYQTQARTLKDSAYWYKNVIATNGASLMSS